VASIYSKRLAYGFVAISGTPTLYTAPTGTTSIIRDIWASPDRSGSGVFYLQINGSDFPIGLVTPTAIEPVHVECRIVLEPGDVLSCQASNAAYQYCISGYELSS
jgi:hypothetical protein